MPDKDRGPESDEGVRITDLSAEVPEMRLGPPYRKEPAPEIVVRGKPAEMLTWLVCVGTTFALLRFGLEMNRYLALALAVVIPWFYGATTEGEGKAGLTIKMRWREHDRRNGGKALS
jgi:hypothetical protein